MKMFLPCLYAFLGCVTFSVIFEEKRPRIILSCSVTGFAAWLVYLLFGFLGTSIRMQTVRYFIAAVVVALLSEMFARIHKSPATLFLTIGIIPLVPSKHKSNIFPHIPEDFYITIQLFAMIFIKK